MARSRVLPGATFRPCVKPSDLFLESIENPLQRAAARYLASVTRSLGLENL